jgi:tripartite-type tricarboxylate transporter receptor subunit TctC
MRKHRLLLAGLVLTLATIAPASAQGYPSRPITVVVPFAAGGALDVMTRIMAERMRHSLGQPVIVENIAGAGGNIGVGRVARAAPDGHTLIMGHWGTHVVNAATYDLTYDVQNSFEPVALTATIRQLIAAKKTMPASDLRSLVAWLHAHPDKAFLGIASGSTHINAVLFQKVTGTRFQFVPYRGLAPAVQDLMAGNIDMMITSAADLLPQARMGTIKVYAVAAKSRLASAPEIPTVDEAGVSGFYTQMWNALWAPARTPKDIIVKLNAAVVEALTDPTVRKRIADLGQETVPREEQTPEALRAFHKAEIEKWWPIIKGGQYQSGVIGSE